MRLPDQRLLLLGLACFAMLGLFDARSATAQEAKKPNRAIAEFW